MQSLDYKLKTSNTSYGHLRQHGAQHRHRPSGLPAPQLYCRLSHQARAQDAAEWCQHLLGNLTRFTFKGLGVKRPGVPLLHY